MDRTYEISSWKLNSTKNIGYKFIECKRDK